MDFVSELVHYGKVYTKKSMELLPTKIEFNELTLVLSGRLEYIINGTEYVLHENDMIFLPIGTLRQRRSLSVPTQYVSFNFLSKISDKLDFDIFMQGAVSKDIRGILSVFSQEKLSLLYHSKEKATCVLNYILYELLDNKSLGSNNYHITKALGYIHENIKSPITLDTLSRHLHLSREYTATLFKKELGKTVSEYVNEKKMQIAKNMINEGVWELREIAEQLGYENYGYFSRLFKRQFNILPSRVAKQEKYWKV